MICVQKVSYMEFLILAHPDDETALRVAAILRRRHGQEAVGIVSAEALAMAPRFVHTLSSTPGRPGLAIDSAITLASGIALLSGEIRAVFNRLRSSDAPHFSTASNSDREYASAETGALWVSWLAGLQSQGAVVINPVWRGILQAGFSQLEWFKLAAQAGLPVGEIQVKAAGLPPAETLVMPAVEPVESVEPTTVLPDESPSEAHPGMQHWLASGKLLLVREVPASGATPGAPGWRIYDGGAADRFPVAVENLPEKIASLQASSTCTLLELIFIDNIDPPRGELGDYCLASVNPFPYLSAPEAIHAVVQMMEDAAR